MTKSIEEQAAVHERTHDLEMMSDGHATIDTLLQVTHDSFISGAKARDAEWFKVVNELRDDIKKLGESASETFPYDLVVEEWSKSALTKADKMLKEMNINKGEHYE